MSRLTETAVFNRDERFIEGWHWALPSHELRRKQIRPVRLLGRDLIVYRGEDGVAQAMDAYCPHMGAHLGEGRVDGTGVRCFFHNWKFDRAGECIDVPCLDRPPRARVRTWPTTEHLGLVWVWPGDEPVGEAPYVPELRGAECDVVLGNQFVKACHPNVMLINAIDEHHFNSVHNLPVELYMKPERLSASSQMFSNTTRVPDSNPLARVVGRFYEGPLTYSMCYHYGATGTVTLGPDAFHFYIMFALRLADGGQTEGQTVLVTRRRPGVAGKAFNRAVLAATRVVGDYFAKGDTQVFQTIRFHFATATKADHAIVDFIRHVEEQPARAFGTWERCDDAGAAKTSPLQMARG